MVSKNGRPEPTALSVSAVIKKALCVFLPIQELLGFAHFSRTVVLNLGCTLQIVWGNFLKYWSECQPNQFTQNLLVGTVAQASVYIKSSSNRMTPEEPLLQVNHDQTGRLHLWSMERSRNEMQSRCLK